MPAFQSPILYALSATWLTVLLIASPARAQAFRCPTHTIEADRPSVARSLFEQALQLEPGVPEAALLRLKCADKLAERAAVALRIGIISERLGRYPQAIAAFESYLERAGDAAPDRAEIEQRIAKLDRRQATESAPKPPPPSAEDPRPRLVGLVTAGIGAAALLTGGALLVAAKVHDDEVHAIEPGTTAWNSDQARGTLEQAKREQGIGIAALVVGAAVAGAGLGVAYWPPGAQTEVLAWQFRPGGATLRVTF